MDQAKQNAGSGGKLLPVQVVDEAIHRSREERARHLLGAIDAGDKEDGVFDRVRTDLMKEEETP
jgi:hypothetical protein